MRLAHSPDLIAALRAPTPEAPLRVLVSGCIAGLPCGVDGTDYGMGGCLADLMELKTVAALTFCPEDVGLGTPRTMPDIHGGDGTDVWDGRARVLDQHGTDLTAGMIHGAEAMLAFAEEQGVELAILTDMSAACGSQVISDGGRFVDERRYQRGVGVATALLLRNGVPVVSQRDFRTLELIRKIADPNHAPDPSACDHHETEWYVRYFGAHGPGGGADSGQAVAEAWSRCLDQEDLDGARALLRDDAAYRSPGGTLVGPDPIIASYRSNADWAHRTFDRIEWSSACETAPDGRTLITFEDRTVHRGVSHVYRCRQLVRIGSDGLISHVEHVAIDEEERALADFFRRVGVER